MEIKINLQLFSGEKTEKATPKKKKDARKKGQVLKSREIVMSLSLLFSFLAIKIFGGFMYKTVYESVLYYTNYMEKDVITNLEAYKALLLGCYFTLKASFIIALANLIVGIVGNYAQVGYLFTVEVLKPDLTKLNPISGLKKLFSLKSLFELLKSCVKLTIIGIVAYDHLKGKMDFVLKSLELSTIQIAFVLSDLVIGLGIKLSSVLIVLGIIDFYYQRFDYEKNLKMSKQEIKEEYKQVEGDPQIKSKIKEKQRMMAMQRMMQDVPQADVVITNPTHYAIALKYDPEVNDAPYILAKGKNVIAQKIRERAKENEIPIVENKPLARKLYKILDIGDAIPPELYEAVAEVLAYIYSKDRVM